MLSVKKFATAAVAVGMRAFGASSAMADSVTWGVDAAPNIYASTSGYDVWKAEADTKISSGTFVNMENGHNSANLGTTNYDALDYLVYRTDPYGTRLTALYFIEGVKIADLKGKLQIGMTLDYLDDPYNNPALHAYGEEWVDPNFANLVEINGGVVGAMGMALEVPKADLLDEAAKLPSYHSYTAFNIRIFDDVTGEWNTFGMTANLNAAVVPTPSAALAGFGLMGITALRRRRSA